MQLYFIPFDDGSLTFEPPVRGPSGVVLPPTASLAARKS